jgi:membrane-bound inhibitor of C-type lysozyme
MLAGQADAGQLGSQTVFACADGTNFTIREAQTHAVLTIDGAPEIVMPKTKFSYGRRYIAGEMTVIVDGDTAFVAIAKSANVLTCRQSGEPKR